MVGESLPAIPSNMKLDNENIPANPKLVRGPTTVYLEFLLKISWFFLNIGDTTKDE